MFYGSIILLTYYKLSDEANSEEKSKYTKLCRNQMMANEKSFFDE